MKFWEAMHALEKGKKVRDKKWPKREWIHKDIDDRGDVNYGLVIRKVVDTEWELYEGPVESNPSKVDEILAKIERILMGEYK